MSRKENHPDALDGLAAIAHGMGGSPLGAIWPPLLRLPDYLSPDAAPRPSRTVRHRARSGGR
jgi:hypothetical protein